MPDTHVSQQLGRTSQVCGVGGGHPRSSTTQQISPTACLAAGTLGSQIIDLVVSDEVIYWRTVKVTKIPIYK